MLPNEYYFGIVNPRFIRKIPQKNHHLCKAYFTNTLLSTKMLPTKKKTNPEKLLAS